MATSRSIGPLAAIVLSPEAVDGRTIVSLVSARFAGDVRGTGAEHGDAAQEAMSIDRFRSGLEPLVQRRSFWDGVGAALHAMVAVGGARPSR